MRTSGPVVEKLVWAAENHDAGCPGGSWAWMPCGESVTVPLGPKAAAVRSQDSTGFWKRGQKSTYFFSEAVCWS